MRFLLNLRQLNEKEDVTEFSEVRFSLGGIGNIGEPLDYERFETCVPEDGEDDVRTDQERDTQGDCQV